MNGDYSLAVHALVYLDHRATHLPSQILAENICTNAARVRKVSELDTGRRTRGLLGVIFNGRSDG